MWEFLDRMIETGRFKSRSAVTLYAIQELMRKEGCTIAEDNGGNVDPTITRTSNYIKQLNLQYYSMKLVKSKYMERVELQKNWLAKTYPKINDMDTNSFIEYCIDDSLHIQLGGE